MYACVESARRIHPELEADAIAIANGVAAFATRGTTPRVLANPNADLSLARVLAAHGYVPVEYEDALGADLRTIEALRDDRIEVWDDYAAWGDVSARAFLGVDPLPDGAAVVGEIIAAAKGVTALAARENGAVVAAGAMDVQGELAGFFASGTLPGFRGRGWQSALILDRVARARERGAVFGRAGAAVGSASERNFCRLRFQVLYTRTLWELPSDK